MKHSLLNGFLAFILVLFVYPVFSEEHESANVLEEIVVTARKREENIQDTALSVSALSGADIADRFPSDIRDLAADSPNLLIDDLQQGPGSPTAIFIRGIGVSDVEKNFDPTTGVYLDGVFVGANSGAMLKTIDLEQCGNIKRSTRYFVWTKHSCWGDSPNKIKANWRARRKSQSWVW